MGEPYLIRPARESDARALCEIERRCFSDPWSPGGFREILRDRHAFGLVAEQGARPLGYVIGRAVSGEGEILNLAVAPEARRRGIASALLDAGLAWLERRGAAEVFLEVRESNAAALALYRRHGFAPVGQRSAYYRNPVEDALVLRRALSAAS
ncbi:MAG TPA: ribosomal protein S18-alanine N-acetyltransferase [Gemmatimonadales bacterium]|nr:ribosomal protein S18-alanine N-acetyltransferase [Gemmatimonadales bacterium]